MTPCIVLLFYYLQFFIKSHQRLQTNRELKGQNTKRESRVSSLRMAVTAAASKGNCPAASRESWRKRKGFQAYGTHTWRPQKSLGDALRSLIFDKFIFELVIQLCLLGNAQKALSGQAIYQMWYIYFLNRTSIFLKICPMGQTLYFINTDEFRSWTQ